MKKHQIAAAIGTIAVIGNFILPGLALGQSDQTGSANIICSSTLSFDLDYTSTPGILDDLTLKDSSNSSNIPTPTTDIDTFSDVSNATINGQRTLLVYDERDYNGTARCGNNGFTVTAQATTPFTNGTSYIPLGGAYLATTIDALAPLTAYANLIAAFSGLASVGDQNAGTGFTIFAGGSSIEHTAFTTVAANYLAGATSIDVASTAGFNASGTIFNGGDKIYYSAIFDADTFTTVGGTVNNAGTIGDDIGGLTDYPSAPNSFDYDDYNYEGIGAGANDFLAPATYTSNGDKLGTNNTPDSAFEIMRVDATHGGALLGRLGLTPVLYSVIPALTSTGTYEVTIEYTLAAL